LTKVTVNKKPPNIVWLDCLTATVKGYQRQPHWKGLIKLYICIKYEVDTTYNFRDIEENVDRQT